MAASAGMPLGLGTAGWWLGGHLRFRVWVQDRWCTTSTEDAEWVTTAAATLPSRCPTSPLRRWEPSTIRLALCSSAVSTIPFQVGAASTAMLCDRNPAFSASDAPCAAVCSRGLLHLGGVLGVEVPVVDGHESDVCRLPDAEDERVAAGRELLAGLLDRELRRARSRRRRRGRARSRGFGLWMPCQSALSVATCVVAIASTDSCQQRRRVPRRAARRRGSARGRGSAGGRRRARRGRRRRAAPATASPKPIQSAMLRAGIEAAADVRGEVDEDRRDHERRHRPQQLDDREHSLQVGRRQREAGDEQRGRDRRAEPDAGQARADEGQRLARGHLDARRPRSRRRGRPCRPAGGSASRAS